MIRLQLAALAAVGALPSVHPHELGPLFRRERTFRREPKRAMFLSLGAHDRRVGSVVLRHPLGEPIGVPRVIRRILGSMRVWMTFAPASHGGACLVGVASNPVAAVGAPLLRVSERHAWLLSKSRCRCNRTGMKT